MISPYAARLVLLCCASFFVLHALFSVLATAAAPSVLRFASRGKSRHAARLLFALRVAPSLAAMVLVLGCCVPSYLGFEPSATEERIGLKCVVLAAACAVLWGRSLLRALRALVDSGRYGQLCRREGWESRTKTNGIRVLVLKHAKPVLALAGIFRPRIVISRGLADALSADELDVVLGHEAAHWRARDNFKRLLLLLSPDFFPMARVAASLERQWSTFSEWAADDAAAEGDARRGIALASALLCSARLGVETQAHALASPLIGSAGADLSARVERLLAAGISCETSEKRQPLFFITTLALGIIVASGILFSTTLPAVYELLERLVR